MLATCFSGTYTLDPLPSGYTYSGPYHANKCDCSTVVYSLISACVACQGDDPSSWSTYVTNCTSTTTMPPSQFPNPVPPGIRVPHWAILDVTNENHWNANKSYAAGDTPEYGPGAIFGASGVYTSSASASPTPSQLAPSHSGGHGGAIAGGVIGGIAIISIISLAAIFYLRRGRSEPILDDGEVAPSSVSPTTMKFYDPDDPTTFPGYQGPSATAPSSSHVGSGSTLGMQTSPHPRGQYSGFPIPIA